MAGLGAAGVFALALGTLCLISGCATVGYYAQSVNGHLDLVTSARPVADWLADPQSPPALKERLALSQRMRDYAVSELALPDNASYRRYADLKRGAAVWNVTAAPELGLTLKTWCFPVVGCVGYRGYFDRVDAERFAAELRTPDVEVYVYGVPAYSTLGKLPFDALSDPLLNTFINYPEGELARLIFHELAHQIAYAQDDTVFNESFAVAVERIGGARWLAGAQQAGAAEEYRRFDSRRGDFRALTQKYRERLLALYKSEVPDDQKRATKAVLMAEMRADHVKLKAERWGGFAGYDSWFSHANNASFGVLAAYSELVPAFERLFERQGRDFNRFYAEVRRLAQLPKDQRRAALNATAGE